MSAPWSPNPVRVLAEELGPGLAASDRGAIKRLWLEGFGIKATEEQIDARVALGQPGPRMAKDPKFLWLSGGQRAGKTVELFIWHAEACLYKIGLDNTDGRFWSNFNYQTLHCAPTNELTLKLWGVAAELAKNSHEAQFDKEAHAVRKGVFCHMFEAGKAGDFAIVRFTNGAHIDFRSTEGKAYRLEGDKWWFETWDEWASQPDREIEFVLTDVLMGRARDFNAKIVPAAWPKPETERHLVAVIRRVEAGLDPDSVVVYLSAENAHFTNKKALATERRRKSDAQWMRTVLGRPAGGASIEFPADVTDNMVNEKLRWPVMPIQMGEGWRFLSSWDIGLAHDSTVGITWAIPAGGVSPLSKARIVNAQEIKSGDGLTLDSIEYAIAREQALYHSQSAIDATGLGGIAASRGLQNLRPAPLRFVARSNDRIHGNMRLAAISSGLDCLTWGRPADDETAAVVPWGLLEAPLIRPLLDQLANFDRDAKGVSDDWVWAFLIGVWYIKRYHAISRGSYRPVPFDVREEAPTVRDRRPTIDMRVR